MNLCFGLAPLVSEQNYQQKSHLHVFERLVSVPLLKRRTPIPIGGPYPGRHRRPIGAPKMHSLYFFLAFIVFIKIIKTYRNTNYVKFKKVNSGKRERRDKLSEK